MSTSEIKQVYTPATEIEQPRLSSIQRIINIFFSPGETFQDINRKPNFLLPIILMIVVGIGGFFIISWHTKPDYEKISRQAVEQRLEAQNKSMSDLPADQQEAINKQISVSAKITPAIIIVSSILLPIIGTAFMALLYWGGVILMGGQTSYKKMAGVTVYAMAATWIATQALNVIVSFLRNPDDIDWTKGVAITSPGMLMPKGSSPMLVSLLSRFDIFTIWFMALMIIGISVTSKNMKAGKAASVVLSFWVIYIVIKLGLSLIGM